MIIQNPVEWITGPVGGTLRLIGLFLVLAVALSPLLPSMADAAGRKSKRPPQPRTHIENHIIVTDKNIMVHQHRVEDLAVHGNYRKAAVVMLKINEFSKEILSFVGILRTQYQKALARTDLSPDKKEDISHRLKNLDRLEERYRRFRESSTFNIGYLYTRMRETEKARVYLTEFFTIVSDSTENDKPKNTALSLLKKLWQLEGAF